MVKERVGGAVQQVSECYRRSRDSWRCGALQDRFGLDGGRRRNRCSGSSGRLSPIRRGRWGLERGQWRGREVLVREGR